MTSPNDPTRSAGAQAASDDDTNDAGDDTPNSGVATPQPDLHDKRLPGIMSYFSQVSPQFWSCSAGEKEASSSESHRDAEAIGETQIERPAQDVGSTDGGHAPAQSIDSGMIFGESGGEQPVFSVQCSSRRSSSGSIQSTTFRASGSADVPALPQQLHAMPMERSASGPASTVVTTLPVLASHLSTNSFIAPSAPRQCQPSAAAIDNIREKLTSVVVKSGPTTPTRALSAAHPSQLDEKEDVPRSGAQTPKPRSNGAQVPTAKGKLTIKIIEAKGLRRSKDPYVVAVFQRSELISSGPRTFNDEDDEKPPAAVAAAPMMMGSIPIQRQSSDSGRSMAIPMKSRQSSNTSVGDYTAFRNRSRRSFTHPKWDAEAIL